MGGVAVATGRPSLSMRETRGEIADPTATLASMQFKLVALPMHDVCILTKGKTKC
jgi:hypothetical protein